MSATGHPRGIRGDDETVLALVTPAGGSAGVFGLSCRMCAELAVREINASGGLLGRHLRLAHIDGGAAPAQVARQVRRLVQVGTVHAVVGWHTSAVRQAVVPAIGGRVPYIYTALYEGGERSPGVLLTGETPASQLYPALEWMARELGVRRWFIVGNDYVWPRSSARAVRSWAPQGGIDVCGERYVPLGCKSFAPVIGDLSRSPAQGVLMFLVGQDAVYFNRRFAAAGLDGAMVRLTTLTDENMLLASGPTSTRDIYAAAGYFDNLMTSESLDFLGRYTRQFGYDAPVPSSLGESCYEGVKLYSELARSAGTLLTDKMLATAENARYESPRGVIRMRRSHTVQSVYLARADATDFDVLQRVFTA